MYNSGAIVRGLNQGSTLTKVNMKPSPMTDARIAAQAALQKYASDSGMTLNDTITALMTSSTTFGLLGYYINTHKESAFNDPLKRAAQAVLIRFSDIATIAKALNISDEQALIQIEAAENEALQNNNPDAGILPIEVQAMMIDCIDELNNAASRNGLPTDSPRLYNLMTNVIADNYSGSASALLSGVSAVLANHADGDPLSLDTSGLNATADAGTILTGTDYNPMTVAEGSADTTASSSDTSGGFDFTSLFGTINGAIGVIKNASGAVTTLTNNAKTSSGTLNGILNKLGGGVGASAINQSKLPLLIGGGILLIVIVIIATHYAGKK